MTRNGIGRKEKERKSTRPPAVSALTASSFSQFQTSVTRNFSSCLLSETIPAIALSSLGTFPEWMHLFDWCRTSSAKCWNRAKVDFGLCIWGEGEGVGWGRGGGPIRDLVSHSMQLPLPTVQYCSQPLLKRQLPNFFSKIDIVIRFCAIDLHENKSMVPALISRMCNLLTPDLNLLANSPNRHRI